MSTETVTVHRLAPAVAARLLGLVLCAVAVLILAFGAYFARFVGAASTGRDCGTQCLFRTAPAQQSPGYPQFPQVYPQRLTRP